MNEIAFDSRIKMVLSLLDETYPLDIKCYLNYETPWQLLIATILSAQCTDDRVNIVTSRLFLDFPTIESFAYADFEKLQNAIKSTGYYNSKTNYIIGSMKLLLEKYDGVMPSDIEELLTFPGVGRKTANVVRSHIFNIPSIVVDTHVKRVSFRLGFTAETDPVKIEFDLMKILPEEHWTRYNTQIIAQGRKVCTARKAYCMQCVLFELCDKKL